MSNFDLVAADNSRSSRQARLAEGLWRAAMVALALMPVGMAIAHRSSPVFLILSTLFSLGAIGVEGKTRECLREARSAAVSPLGVAILAFLGWCLVSVGWSEFKGASLRALGEFWLPVAAAFVLALTLARRVTRPAFWLLAGAFVLSCFMMLFELSTGLAFRQSAGVRSYSFIFNRPVLTLLVLSLPLLAWFLGHVRQGRMWGLVIFLLLAGMAYVSDSGAAVLGLIVASIAFAAGWLAPRLTRGLLAVGLVAAVIAAPMLGTISRELIPRSVHKQIAGGHSRERVRVWTSFGAAVQKQPLLGAGFGVSPRMHETAVAQTMTKRQKQMLAIGHPHNAALQIWVELGGVGIVLALAVILLVLRAVAGLPQPFLSASLALVAGAAAVAFVGHGAWQGWWAASLGSAIIWMLAAIRTQPETRP